MRDPRALFERSAAAYDRHAAFEREVAGRLLERAVFQRREPRRIVDLGCGTGYCAEALGRRFPQAEVIGIDFALAMCRQAQVRPGLRRPARIVCAGFDRLPLAARSADLLVASMAFQWTDEFANLFNELRRVIRPDGMLLFGSLGPGSMRELRAASTAIGIDPGCRPFPDMHDVGDALVAAGFDEPVMDSETITVDYPGFDELLAELEATGAAGHCLAWATVRDRAGQIAAAWAHAGGQNRFPIAWEVIYGAAFGPPEGQPFQTPQGHEATFSVEALRAKLKRR